MRTAKQMERQMKGVANHWRIRILFHISRNSGTSLEGIVDKLGGNIKTISEHTRRLASAGLVDKKYEGRVVAHTLTPYGKIINKFLATFQHS